MGHRTTYRRLLALVGVVVPLVTGTAAVAAGGIVVDLSKRLQTIDGFGSGMPTGFAMFERGRFDSEILPGVTFSTTPEQRQEMLETLFRDLGFAHGRFFLFNPRVEPENDNDDPQVLNWEAFRWRGDSDEPQSEKPAENRSNGIEELGRLLQAAIPLGLEVWVVTPSRLPPWLHSRLRKAEDPERFEEYAEWAAAQLLYLKREFGLEAPFWSLHNEPDEEKWRDPSFLKEWLLATGRRFAREGLGTKIMFPDFARAQRAIDVTAEALRDPEARSYVGALAYHHYGSSGNGPRPFAELSRDRYGGLDGTAFKKVTADAVAMADLGGAHGLPSWQTETAYYPQETKGLPEWEIGMARANEIFYEVNAGAAAVHGLSGIGVDVLDPRIGVSGRYAGHHIVLRSDGKRVSEWEITKDCGVVFAHFGRFVRPGDRRVAASWKSFALRVVAFASQSGDRVVAVIINNADKPRTVPLKLRGHEGSLGHAAAMVTDETVNLAPLELEVKEGGGSWTARLPARSIATVVISAADVAEQMQAMARLGAATVRSR